MRTRAVQRPGTRRRAYVLALFTLLVVGLVPAACGSGSDSRTLVSTPAAVGATSATTTAATAVAGVVSTSLAVGTPVGGALHGAAPREFIVESGRRTLAINIATGAKRQILAIPRALLDQQAAYASHFYAASPSGERIAFLCGDDPAAICVLDAGKSTPQRVTSAQDFARPGSVGRPWLGADPFDWSPDGQRFVFQVTIGGSSDSDMYVADLAAGTVRRVIETTLDEHWTNAFWSADGQHIALRSTIEGRGSSGEATNLFVVDVASGARLDLAASMQQPVLVDQGFSWSPDSAMLAFVARDQTAASVSHLYVSRADGSDMRAIASNLNALEASPILWSPDGRWVTAFERSRLYAVRSDGSDQRALGGAVAVRAIAWEADSTHLAVRVDGCLEFAVLDVGVVFEEIVDKERVIRSASGYLQTASQRSTLSWPILSRN